MNRRDFVVTLTAAPAAMMIYGCGREHDSHALASVAAGFRSFGYYQGLLPDELRSSSRNDGTYSNMPCIPEEDVMAGTEKTYRFWHGHGTQHMFTVTEEDFRRLAMGESVEIYTTVVGGHRHALRIAPAESCTA